MDKKITLKKRVILQTFRFRQLVIFYFINFKKTLVSFFDTFYFQALAYALSICAIQVLRDKYNINFTDDQLVSLGFAIAGIIGASIAIIFSFSTFILQSTAELFSTQYLNQFIQDKKEKYIFWGLVLLTFLSVLVPILKFKDTLEVLLTLLFFSFVLIYSLYKELRQRINPETTLYKIKADATTHLKSVKKEFSLRADVQTRIYEYEGNEAEMTLAIQYKAYPDWTVRVSNDIKYLYEIGLRLLSKNEINSFNLSLAYIRDIYIDHLTLRSGHIACVPAGFWGTYTFEDENFTSKVLEYLESTSQRLIQEKRKENIYYLLHIYETIINHVINFKYAEVSMYTRGENPILSLVLGYYIGFIDQLVQSNERDWIWEGLKSLNKISNNTLAASYSHFNHNQINEVIDRTILHCAKNSLAESLVKQAVSIYFDQIKTTWNKYPDNEILLQDIFKGLKKATLALVISSENSLASSEVYIGFNTWLTLVCNELTGLPEGKDKDSAFKNFVSLLEHWSDYILDFARGAGLENKGIGLQLIQAVDCNLRIIYYLNANFKHNFEGLYVTQMNTLSWYFQNTKTVDSSHLFNLEEIQETLLSEISGNLENERFKQDRVISLYIELVKQHFEIVSLGHGYNHPRVIEKLIFLGLILQKHNKSTDEIVALIEMLNARYLHLNKDHFKMKEEIPNLMGPNKHQLCLEIHELEDFLFSYRSSMGHGAKAIIRSEITREVWDAFIPKIQYCKGIEYETVRSIY